MHYGNTNIEAFGFSSGPPLKNLFFMYKTSDTGLIIETQKSTRYSFLHILKFKMLAQDWASVYFIITSLKNSVRPIMFLFYGDRN